MCPELHSLSFVMGVGRGQTMQFPTQDLEMNVNEEAHAIFQEWTLSHNETPLSIRSLQVFNHRHCNGGVPLLRGDRRLILKDTEVHLTHKDVSPQYSLKSQDSLPADSSGYRAAPLARRDSAETRASLSRQSSLASVSLYHPGSRHNSVASSAATKENLDPGANLDEEAGVLRVDQPPTVPDCKNDKCEINENVSLAAN